MPDSVNVPAVLIVTFMEQAAAPCHVPVPLNTIVAVPVNAVVVVNPPVFQLKAALITLTNELIVVRLVIEMSRINVTVEPPLIVQLSAVMLNAPVCVQDVTAEIVHRAEQVILAANANVVAAPEFVIVTVVMAKAPEKVVVPVVFVVRSVVCSALERVSVSAALIRMLPHVIPFVFNVAAA